MNIIVTSKNCDNLIEALSDSRSQAEKEMYLIHNWMIENSGKNEDAAFDNRRDKSHIKQYIEFLEKLKSKTVAP